MALAHAVGGDGVVPDRLPAALTAWATGLVIALLVWRAGAPGRLTTTVGLAAAALWWALPFAPGRTAVLEAPMLLFLMAAQLAWVTAAVRRDPRWLLLGGVLTGLAAASKLPGLLALVGALPALWSLVRRPEDDPPAPDGRRGIVDHALAATATRLTAIAVLALAAYLLTYLPMGTVALDQLAQPVTYQVQHAADGHPVVVAGEVTEHAPWWAPFAFQAAALGPVPTGALWSVAVVGALRHRDRLAPVWLTLAALTIALVTSPLKLPHYHYAWWPPLVVLASAALLPGRVRAPRAARERWLSAACALGLVPVVLAGAQHVQHVATIEGSDYDLAAARVEAELPADATVVVWADPGAVQAAFGDRPLSTRLPPDLDPPALLWEEAHAVRQDGMDLTSWERCRTARYARHDLGAVTLFVREGDPLPGSRPPGCDGLLQQR